MGPFTLQRNRRVDGKNQGVSEHEATEDSSKNTALSEDADTDSYMDASSKELEGLLDRGAPETTDDRQSAQTPGAPGYATFTLTKCPETGVRDRALPWYVRGLAWIDTSRKHEREAHCVT